MAGRGRSAAAQPGHPGKIGKAGRAAIAGQHGARAGNRRRAGETVIGGDRPLERVAAIGGGVEGKEEMGIVGPSLGGGRERDVLIGIDDNLE